MGTYKYFSYLKLHYKATNIKLNRYQKYKDFKSSSFCKYIHLFNQTADI